MAKATRRTRLDTLEAWCSVFPTLTPWQDVWLLRRHGALVSGICLDETSDKRFYNPAFFIHNLVAPFPGMSLSWRAYYLQRGVPTEVRYTADVEPIASKLRSQVDALANGLSFVGYVDHIKAAVSGQFGPLGARIRIALKEIILLGAHLGDRAYYRAEVGVCAARMGTETMLSPAEIEAWRDETLQLLDRDLDAAVAEEAKKLKLPRLEIEPLPYVRIEGIWDELDAVWPRFPTGKIHG